MCHCNYCKRKCPCPGCNGYSPWGSCGGCRNQDKEVVVAPTPSLPAPLQHMESSYNKISGNEQVAEAKEVIKKTAATEVIESEEK